MTRHIQFENGVLILLDQRYLPTQEDWFHCKTVDDVIYALQTMVVRGAPAIGVTAAYGCWIALREAVEAGGDWKVNLNALLDKLEAARPTAVNLRWAVRLMKGLWADNPELDAEGLSELWLNKAKEVHAEDIETNKTMGRFGAAVIAAGDNVMTHCNAGALATAGYGTALGVIRAAHEEGKKISVIANETRPFLQGARLTAYELAEDNIPVRVACDNAAALLMRKKLVDKIVVGADRIAANGDVANKIGTCMLAVLADKYGVPFYVAAPLSTIDRETPSGDEIPIEERTPTEVTHVGQCQITPNDVPVFNYAFDITPNELIAGIVTEQGILKAPYVQSIQAAFKKAGL